MFIGHSGYLKTDYAFARCESCGAESHTYCVNNIRAAARGERYTITQARAAALDELTAPGGIRSAAGIV